MRSIHAGVVHEKAPERFSRKIFLQNLFTKISIQDLLKKNLQAVFFKKILHYKKSVGKICLEKSLQAGQAAQFADYFRGHPTSKVASHISLSGLSE